MAYGGNTVRIILIGKTGNGKSTTGNAILGQDFFMPSRGMSSVTMSCSWKTAVVDGLTIEVTDTPGVRDTHRDKREIQEEIAKCLATMTPGPDAVLLVINGDRRFTDEEHQAYLDLKEVFGDNLADNLILVFTATKPDELEKDLKAAPPKLLELLEDASHRYACFGRNLRDRENRKREALELLKVVRRLVAEKSSFYTNSLLKMYEEMMLVNARGRGVTVDKVKEEILADKSPMFMQSLTEAVPDQISANHTYCALM